MTARSILVVNSKGGSGKSTLSTNLASYYASQGVHTALYDFDRQRSSLRWLDRRPQERQPIEAVSGWSSKRPPNGTERVVMDAPAQIDRHDLITLVARADAVVIPVLPSPIDIDATAEFIGVLFVHAKIRVTRKPVGVVANRVKANTLVYARLQKFLRTLQIPFITSLRDTQNYIHAAEGGVGIFELDSPSVSRDIVQWQPLIDWIEDDQTTVSSFRSA